MPHTSHVMCFLPTRQTRGHFKTIENFHPTARLSICAPSKPLHRRRTAEHEGVCSRVAPEKLTQTRTIFHNSNLQANHPSISPLLLGGGESSSWANRNHARKQHSNPASVRASSACVRGLLIPASVRRAHHTSIGLATLDTAHVCAVAKHAVDGGAKAPP